VKAWSTRLLPLAARIPMLELRRHLNTLHALIIRDLMVRFGRHHLGFIWTILEPMILCAGVMLLWSMLREPVIHGMPLAAFVLTGYMPLTLWRHLQAPMTRILRGNASLLYHRPVSHAHIMLARGFLEFFSTSAALMVIYFVVTTTGVVEPVADPGLALAAWLSAGWYFAAGGMLIGAWTEYWEPAEKFIQPAMYLQLPLSGAFFMVDWMPAYAQKLLLLNPAVHCWEMFRAGFFGDAITTHHDPVYLAFASAATTALAAAAIYHVRDHIQTTGV
jgi:capsular polysaccharide transport system permease protein